MNFKDIVRFRGAFSRLMLGPAAAVALAVSLTAVLPQGALASSGGPPIPKQSWSFNGVFGTFDVPSVKRGAQVAVEVCMSCHSIKYIKFDQLRQFGFSEVEVKTLAESQGRGKKDAMISSMDPISAKEAFGTVPTDLSLITKARKGYENFTYAILTGYATDADRDLATRVMEDGRITEAEALEVASALYLDARLPEAMAMALKRLLEGENFNKYFPGHFLAMPAPLFDGAVTYIDGTENTLTQMSRDVVTFLAWAAEPTMMERKALGIKVILYLLVLTIMLYAVKRRVWAKVH